MEDKPLPGMNICWGAMNYYLDDICDFRLQSGRQERAGNPDGNAGREINTILSERAHRLMRQTFEVACRSVGVGGRGGRTVSSRCLHNRSDVRKTPVSKLLQE